MVKNWEHLISGKLEYNFKCVPAGLMFSRLKREFGKNSSQDNVRKLIDEAYDFFIKYESILGDDIKQIFK